MSRYKLVVLTNAVEGRDEAFNDWYNNHHLAEVVAIPGFHAAQRFKLHRVTTGAFENRYLAIYDIDAEDPDAAWDALAGSAEAGKLWVSDTLDLNGVNCAVFEACSPEVLGPEKPDHSV